MMSLLILFGIIAIARPGPSLAAALHRDSEDLASDDTNFKTGISAPLRIYGQSAPPPAIEETHMVSASDKTVLSAGSNAILSKTEQTSTLKSSPQAEELINQENQTFATKQDDERAVSQMNQVQHYAQGQNSRGVSDRYLKDGTDAIFTVEHSQGDREMLGVSQSNVAEELNDPNGPDQKYLTVEDHDLHQVERDDNLEMTGNSEKESTYMAGTPDDVRSFYVLNQVDQHNLIKNAQGVEQDSNQSNVVGVGYTDDIIETLAVNDTQNTIKIDKGEVQVSVGVDESHGAHHSTDLAGNHDVTTSDSSNHNIRVKDGSTGVSLNTNNMTNVYGFRDHDGVMGVYEGNGTDHSLTITEGELTTNFNRNSVDELIGISSPDGVDDVYRVNQAGKSVMIDDGERGVAVGANEINELHGVFENGQVQESYHSNQRDNVVAHAEGTSGGSLQISQISGVYRIEDADNPRVVATEGQMVSRTRVIGDNQGETDDEGGEDEYSKSSSTEASDQDGRKAESPLVVALYGMSAPVEYEAPGGMSQEQDVLTITEGTNPHPVDGSKPEAGFSSSMLIDLIDKVAGLYRESNHGIGSVVGGGEGNTFDINITINM